jgi:hypothetical protein
MHPKLYKTARILSTPVIIGKVLTPPWVSPLFEKTIPATAGPPRRRPWRETGRHRTRNRKNAEWKILRNAPAGGENPQGFHPVVDLSRF